LVSDIWSQWRLVSYWAGNYRFPFPELEV
jgi:hypothetical protein